MYRRWFSCWYNGSLKVNFSFNTSWISFADFAFNSSAVNSSSDLFVTKPRLNPEYHLGFEQ